MSTKPMSIFDASNTTRSQVINTTTRDRTIYCGNCGEKNHIYKDCHHPIISLGVILFKYERDTDKIRFLLVRRKDSIGYVEFIRGKYASTDIQYIKKLFGQMSQEELDKINKLEFSILWEKLWMQDKFQKKKKKFNIDYDLAIKKFNKIKEGYMVNNEKISIENLTKNIDRPWKETEWGLPKGRRNIKENDYDAAKREFIEETGVNDDNFNILSNIPTFIEQYEGTDNIKYKHIYYLAKANNDIKLNLDKNSRHQITEISNLGFFELEECQELIRDYYVEKKKILIEADKYIRDNKIYNVTYQLFKDSLYYSPCKNSRTISQSI